MFNSPAAIVDLEVLIKAGDDGVIFSPYLPGYFRDLSALRGRVVGLCRETWASGIDLSPLTDRLQRGSFILCVLSESDPMKSLFTFRSKHNLNLERSVFYLSRTSGFKDFVDEAGIERLSFVRENFLP